MTISATALYPADLITAADWALLTFNAKTPDPLLLKPVVKIVDVTSTPDSWQYWLLGAVDLDNPRKMFGAWVAQFDHQSAGRVVRLGQLEFFEDVICKGAEYDQVFERDANFQPAQSFAELAEGDLHWR